LSVRSPADEILENGRDERRSRLSPLGTGTAYAARPSPVDYLNFSIPPSIGWFNPGSFDVLIVPVLSRYRRIRDGSLLITEALGLSGFALADLFVLTTSYSNLPMIPVLTLGWLISDAMQRRLPRPEADVLPG
jgi:hypothetical protein